MILRAMLAVAYATGRASHARQVQGDDPDKKEYPGHPGVGIITSRNKKLIVTKVEQYCSTGQSPHRAVATTEEEVRHPTDSIIFITQKSTNFSKIHKLSSNSRRQNSDVNRVFYRRQAVL
jgi:hypothetical protein